MKIERLASCLLAAVVITTSISLPYGESVNAIAAETSDIFSYEDFECTYLEDGTVEISGYTGSAAELVIPEEIDGYEVTEIGVRAFRWCTSLTSVTLPDSVTVIGDEAFELCTNLMSITIPDNVVKIGENAFSRCDCMEDVIVGTENEQYSSEDGVLYNADKTKLILCPAGKGGYITIPDSVTTIGDEAFADCQNLENIIMPNGVTNIGYGAFSGCGRLEEIIIPDTVVMIGDWAFSYCGNLKNIIISANLTAIGDYVFAQCNGLQNIAMTNNVAKIGKGAFSGCESMQNVTIPDSVTIIGDGAFQGCNSLEEITIPNSITAIGDEAFRSCSRLENINVSEDNENYYSENGILYNADKTILICCPAGKGGDVAVPNGILNIEEMAFYECTNLESVELAESVMTIGGWAFAQCSSLKNIKLSQKLEAIGAYAIRGCGSLKSIVIPGSVTSIGDMAFDDWTAIYGYTGSFAETYASEIGRIFHALETIWGDIDQNGTIDYFDAMAVLQYDAELIELTDEQLLAGDVNGDGSVDSFDAVKILQYDAELIESFE